MANRDRRQRPQGPPPARHDRDEGGEVVQGLQACLAVFARRRDDVLRVMYGADVSRSVTEVVRWCHSRGIPCREGSDAELDDVAGSSHHEGLCMRTKPRRWASAQELAELLVQRRGTAIAMDRVRNPYNVGAILRTAAFFESRPRCSNARSPPGAIADGRAGRRGRGGASRAVSDDGSRRDTGAASGASHSVVGADGAAPASVFGFAFVRPTVLVLGHEREGLGERIRKNCDAVVAIPGGGAIESLNVGVAAGVLVAEMLRR